MNMDDELIRETVEALRETKAALAKVPNVSDFNFALDAMSTAANVLAKIDALPSDEEM